ncbi:MAG: lamin tail domain-containing protein, partial [Pirellulales bacterium]
MWKQCGRKLGPRKLGYEVLERRELLAGDLVISEFLASNSTGLQDEDGDRSDWIEIRNPGPARQSLAGWYLTDDARDLRKWRFPDVRLAAGGQLVVFASGKDRSEIPESLHTNFRLDADGEFLAIVQPDGSTVASAYAPAFPPQRAGVSYGIGEEDAFGFFATPTPGAANDDEAFAVGFADDVQLSAERGIYTEPLNVTISTETPGASLLYTTDGSAPSPVNGVVVRPTSANAVPATTLRLSETTILRVMAVKERWIPSPIV